MTQLTEKQFSRVAEAAPSPEAEPAVAPDRPARSAVPPPEPAAKRRRFARMAASASPLVAPRAAWVEWTVWSLTLGLLATIYALHLNPYWALAGDGDFYLAMARNLAQGEGLWHNGQPVATVPPGWPALLAAAMTITSRLGVLKLLNVACLLIFLGAMFRVGRRTAPLGVVTGATLLVGLSADVVAMGWFFLTDPPFCAVGALAVLAALKVGESVNARRGDLGWGWWAAATILLAAVSVTIRWPGILLVPLLAAALLQGAAWWRPRLDRRWATLLLTTTAVVATFFIQRALLPIDGQHLVDSRYPAFMTGEYDLINSYGNPEPIEYLYRFSGSGRYISSLIWEPLASMKATYTAVDYFGWVVWIAWLAGAVVTAMRRRWLLLGAGAFCLPIMITWPQAVERYLLIAMPLILAGAMVGVVPLCRGIARLFHRRRKPAEAGEREGGLVAFGHWAAVGLLVVTFALQGFMLWVTINVFRSAYGVTDDRGNDLGRQFHQRFSGGIHRRLPAIAFWIERNADPHAEIGISQVNNNRSRYTRVHGFMRALHTLTDRPIQTVPYSLGKPLEESPETVEWLREHDVRYYVYLPRYDQTLHFRGGQLEKMLFDDAPLYRVSERELREQDWRLYEVFDEPPASKLGLPRPFWAPPKAPGWRRVPVSGGNPHWPRTVPHLSKPAPRPDPMPRGLVAREGGDGDA